MAGVRSMESALLDLYFHDIADSSPLPAAAETELARRIRAMVLHEIRLFRRIFVSWSA